jgi:hypothetical protein
MRKMTRNLRPSPFMKALVKYSRPKPGEVILTGRGPAEISRILPYDEVNAGMKRDGVPSGEIERFDVRVENFLGKKDRYFECELTYADGEVERIDWSEYLAMRNRRKG